MDVFVVVAEGEHYGQRWEVVRGVFPTLEAAEAAVEQARSSETAQNALWDEWDRRRKDHLESLTPLVTTPAKAYRGEDYDGAERVAGEMPSFAFMGYMVRIFPMTLGEWKWSPAAIKQIEFPGVEYGAGGSRVASQHRGS